MIPVATTTIRVERATDADTVDPWDQPTTRPDPTTVATGVRAVIRDSRAAGFGPGDAQSVGYVLVCDPVDLTHKDVVVDERSGEAFEVEWALSVPGVSGLESMKAGLTVYRS